MGLIVQKFGGSSVRDAERVMNDAQIVTDTYRAGNDVVVVVSAQGDTTDDLIERLMKLIQSHQKEKWICLWHLASRFQSHFSQWLVKS